MSARSRGAAGEALAQRFLLSKGLCILARNFSCRYGEIDLIARDGEETVFVEVKLRHDADFSRAADAVTPAKRERLKKTALFYFAQQGECPARFDVVEIYDKGSPARIHWIRNAFS
mgnify:CR=1